MKLIEFKTQYDFGRELYIHFLTSRRFNFIQFYYGWDDYDSFPCLTLNILGNCQVFSIYFKFYKLSLMIDLICYYPRHLDEMRIQ